MSETLTVSNSAEQIATAMEIIQQHEFIEYRFTDLNGVWHHMAFAVNDNVDESIFTAGAYFDGSSVIGWQPIDQSDMIFLPDASTVKSDPFPKRSTCVVICDVLNPEDKSIYSKCPRAVARRCNEYIKNSGIADYANVGPEGEFFLFDNFSYENSPNSVGYSVDSEEGWWNTNNKKDNKGYQIQAKKGYFPCPPVDKAADVRNDMVAAMEDLGLEVEAAHHEVGTAQQEIDFRFDRLLEVSDKMQWYKHVVKNVAFQADMMATFLPKPLYGDNGSGMHCHLSLHTDAGENLFTGDESAGLSQTALYFVGGVIAHSRACCVFTNPTTNSYKRLTPGFEAPTNMCYSARNRSAAVRIPMSHPKARRIEYRTPDPMACPYLCYSALLMAGLDGIKNKIDPGLPQDKDLFELSAEEIGDIIQAPGSLEEAIECLKEDRAFLEEGGVFSAELIDTVIELRTEEVEALNKRPHPFEFEMYGSR